MSLKRKREDSASRVDDLAHSYLALQAYEATIKPAHEQRAVKLSDGTAAQGSGLIKWTPAGSTVTILVDRYDARLLLSDEYATKQSPHQLYSGADDGWDDLPSDSEDLFYFSRDEADDIRREKRRKTIESNRLARLAALKAEEEPSETLNPSDEEPDELQLALMKKTASHIASSPNPLQLEMRILANHGIDKRFAFLRGRWKNAWSEIKRDLGKASAKEASMSTGLVTYDDDSEEDGAGLKTEPLTPKSKNLTVTTIDDAQIKAERRARVKEWSLKRKQLAIDKKEDT